VQDCIEALNLVGNCNTSEMGQNSCFVLMLASMAMKWQIFWLKEEPHTALDKGPIEDLPIPAVNIKHFKNSLLPEVENNMEKPQNIQTGQ
jgi:hypothetical protein